MPKSFTVDEDYNDSRLDKWFKDKIINLPHSLIEKIIRQNKIKADMTLICDYGHNFISKKIANEIIKKNKFIFLNAQINSSN